MSPARLTVFFPQSARWGPQPPAKRLLEKEAPRHQKRAAKQSPKGLASPLESARRRHPGLPVNAREPPKRQEKHLPERQRRQLERLSRVPGPVSPQDPGKPPKRSRKGGLKHSNG